jgi:hypothetical protein
LSIPISSRVFPVPSFSNFRVSVRYLGPSSILS